MSKPGDPAEIRREIDATREELGETVEALAAKTDVAGQAKRKLQETRAQVTGTAEDIAGRVKQATPESAAAAAGQAATGARQKPWLLIAGAVALGFFLLRRRRGR